MIHGIGTDIVAVARLRGMWERHGKAIVDKILAADEQADFGQAPDKGRFLAKRFAAKEAFAKALGTGVRAPATLPAIAVVHDELGKPLFQFAPELSSLLAARGMVSHLSISDEAEYAVAYVIIECP